MQKIWRLKKEAGIDNECQCSLGHERLGSAPPPLRPSVPQLNFRAAEEKALKDPCRVREARTAPPVFTAKPRKDRTDHILVTCRFPGHFDGVMQHFFHACTPMRIVKCKLAKLMSIPNCTLAVAIGRTGVDLQLPVGEYSDPENDAVLLDIYVKDGTVPPHMRPPLPFVEDVFAPGADGRKIFQFIVIKFQVRIQNDTFTRAFPYTHTVMDVKNNLGELFSMDPDNFKIYRLRLLLRDDALLWHLDYDDYGNLYTELVTRDGARINLELLYVEEELMDEVISVTVDCGPCEKTKILNVHIQDKKINKPYLGGYKNVHTDVEYHHAYSQTQQRPPRVPYENTRERDTQTAVEVEKIDDTPYSRAIQMNSDSVYIPSLGDRVVTPGHYETYDEMVARLRLDHYAAIIQRAYRHYRFRKLVWDWLAVCRERIERMKEEDRLEREAFERRLRKDFIAKTFPRTREDFEHLYTMLERWKNAEIARISKLHSQGPKIAEFSLLLDKEVELLRRIEEYRAKVKEDAKDIKVKAFLDEICKPVAWIASDQRLITMHTVEAQRARKLRDLYTAFCKEDLGAEDRLALLLDLKYSLREHCNPLCEDIIELLDRECELIVRNCTRSQLEFLRKRTRAHILQFIRTSELNAGVTRRKETADFRNMQDGKVYVCDKCEKTKHYTQFPLQARTAAAPAGKAACTSCSWLRTTSTDCPGTESGPYRLMLRSVRREERRRRAWGSQAFVLQERDVQYIVEKLWHARSAIGGCQDLMQLRLCRWDVNEEWSPWNCLVATVPEMRAHLKLEKPEETYDEELVRAIKTRHCLARFHFRRLLAVEDKLSGTGVWHKVHAKASDYVDAVEAL